MKNPEGFFTYDHLLIAPLAARDWRVVDVPWNETAFSWNQVDAVIIRSPWDYQQAPRQFLDVLASITRSGTPLFNSLEVVRWNIRKTYLLDLERLGIPIVPTIWGAQLTSAEVSGAFEQFETDQLVVKPVVGANADHTYRLRHGDSQALQLALQSHGQREYQLQPFLSSIQTDGEWSLFVFGGQYSHAILKRPARGDFRVQEEHGGQLLSVQPDQEARRLATEVFNAIPFDTLYARIDLVRLPDGTLAVMEVELIEPSLYFGFDQRAPELFCEQFVAAMN